VGCLALPFWLLLMLLLIVLHLRLFNRWGLGLSMTLVCRLKFSLVQCCSQDIEHHARACRTCFWRLSRDHVTPVKVDDVPHRIRESATCTQPIV
jgi:hypothetical protein